ncbi:hypothetical protein DXG01_001471 [Tephrocybe rancida]|nr:hypothetical protein DXG01_001471 [Tephrocybe rancida]
MSNIEQDSSRESVIAEKFDNLAYKIDSCRRAALQEIDDAPFSYDTFAINIASVMLGYVYGTSFPQNKVGQQLSKTQDLGIKVAAPVGTLFGQLLFGYLADVVGRKRMYGIELIIIIVATFVQAMAGDGHAVGIISVLVVLRFLMGIGIGGDYPLSAVISSEFAPTRIRGRSMVVVFAAQGWGNFFAALVAFVIVSVYKEALLNDPGVVDTMWRILIGLGCVPGVLALYFRLTIPETPRFTMDIERNVHQATEDIKNVLTIGNSAVDPDTPVLRANAPKASWADFRKYFGQWKNMKVLIGTSWSWFALDIAYYGLGLNSSIVLNAIGFGTPTSGIKGSQLIFDNLNNICIGNLILSAGGLIPGYYFSFMFIDRWGRKPIQLMGFIILTILFIIMGFGYDKLTHTPVAAKGFVVLYCLANFFQNFGPNTTTFVIPGEVFPTRYRSTAHGISAASGKLGAIIAQVGFAQLKDIGGTDAFLKHILEIFALFMLTGVFSTLLLSETNGFSLEQLSNEDQEGFIKGIVRNTVISDGVIVTT